MRSLECRRIAVQEARLVGNGTLLLHVLAVIWQGAPTTLNTMHMLGRMCCMQTPLMPVGQTMHNVCMPATMYSGTQSFARQLLCNMRSLTQFNGNVIQDATWTQEAAWGFEQHKQWTRYDSDTQRRGGVDNVPPGLQLLMTCRMSLEDGSIGPDNA